MRAILEDMRTGTVRAYDVPQPELRPGGILVRTAFSAVSSGTERAVVEAGEMSLLSKARTRPDLVKKVLDTARTDGLRAAYEKVQTRLNTLTPMGYSAAGIVQAVGEGVHEFQVGERVACAGVGFANHSEINWVPRNLAVHVPASVSLEAASLTTIAAIALQGLRQAQVALGETVAVVGAGLVGVLTIQLARAAGCRVIAVDADASRVDKALALGAHLALQASDPRLAIAVRDFSRYGADAAIVTASSSTAEPLELAADIMRDRGRIVIVGDVNMGVSRRSVYPKEISITMSRSYGPGRYDPAYELDGNDYPVGYVRWTERRNMEAVLDLQATGAVDFQPLLQKRCPIEEGERAYADLLAGKDYTVIFEYGSQERKAETAAPRISAVRPKVSGRLRVGCIGASGFARNSIFPHLKADVVVSLASVASGSGVGAESAKRSFGFARTQTPTESIQDPELDALFIVTPNQHHAEYASAGLRAGKAVFVEKPLAVDQQQLNLIRRAYFEAESSGRRPFLTVGFNRRFAPLSERIKSFFSGRQEPMAVHIRGASAAAKQRRRTNHRRALPFR
jgi:threonine dehydrogenase-like Zn-dependent dehydrogenase